MKKVIFVLTILGFWLNSYAYRDEIRLSLPGQQDDHLEHFVFADQPDVYYDNDTHEIIIDGGGEVTYYDVEIASVTTTLTVISTQVNGYYDTIDISSLPQDEYVITIYSPEDHTYEGFFEV